MKKGIKYAGIAAATLLAVSPVVAPVVGSTTQTVQAAVSTTQTTDDSASTDIDTFLSQFGNQTLTGPEIDAMGKIANTYYGQELKASTFVDAANLFNTSLRINDAKVQPNFGDKATIKLTATDSEKNAALDATDFAALAGKGDSFIFTLTVSYEKKDGSKITQNKVFTVKQKANTDVAVESNSVSAINAKYTTPYTVALDSKTINAKLTRSFDVSLADQNGKNIKFAFNGTGTIYKSAEGAKSANAEDVFSGEKFNDKSKTYYQAFKLSLTDKALGLNKDGQQINLQDLLTKYNNNAQGIFTINGEEARSGQFSIQETKGTSAVKEVKDENGNVTTPAKDAVAGKHSLTFIRTIKVSDAKKPVATWTTSAVKGKVVIAKDKIAKLYTTKNEQATRSLAGYSGWLTTTKRTNAAGVTQYQVSTDEWINAEDATFVAADSTETNANETDNAAGLTNIQKLTGYHKVTLAGPASFLYSLFDKDMNRSNRVIAGDSAWFTDQTAQDSKGVTYYRISTNEWIPAGNGLTFK